MHSLILAIEKRTLDIIQLPYETSEKRALDIQLP